MSLKILVLMPYYNRPIMLRRALLALREADRFHSEWHLSFCDDNSPVAGEPVVREVLSGFHDRITFRRTEDTIEKKIAEGLSIGRVANEEMLSSDSDIAVPYCDDDLIVPTYFRDISRFYEANPGVMYAWSKVHVVGLDTTPSFFDLPNFNNWDGRIDPRGKIDGSQVSYRLSCIRDHGCRYPDLCNQRTGNLDEMLFGQFFERFGPAPFTGLVAQHKGVHRNQLFWHKFLLPEYYDTLSRLGGAQI